MGIFDGIKYDTTKLEIESKGRTDYIIESLGYLNGEQVDGHDNVGEKRAAGHVNGGTDVYAASNVMKGIAFPEDGEIGDYTLRLNGQEVQPYHINAETMRIRTSADAAPYDFIVIGTIWGGRHTNKEDHVTTLIDGDGGGVHRVRGEVLSGGMDEWYVDGWAPWPESNQELTVRRDSRKLTYDGNPPLGVVEE